MNLDDILQLQQPLNDGGIRTVNFFNGRLLTARDLGREQAARREAAARLGLALGDGVAFGLDAQPDRSLSAPAEPVLRIGAGLAVNRAGQTLRLARDASVALVRQASGDAAAGCDCDFERCTPLPGGTYVAGAGVYLLTIAPSTAAEGRAATNGLDASNVRCNVDATVEGLQFRLLALDPRRYADLDVASTRFRNRLAYRCFGIDALDAAGADPWRSDPSGYGLIDELRQPGGGLDDREVPLALLYWTASGLQFVDNWAARRRLLAPDAMHGEAFRARRRRLIEADAMCEQFRDHLADLLAAAPVSNALVATDHFRYWPPFGVVPLEGGAVRGVAETVFFDGIVRRPGAGAPQAAPFIDVRLLGALREQALGHAPTDLTQHEFVWFFRPWQNARAAGAPAVRVFASGLMPEPAPARADMACFDFSNAAKCCPAPEG